MLGGMRYNLVGGAEPLFHRRKMIGGNSVRPGAALAVYADFARAVASSGSTSASFMKSIRAS